jgi:hypothetical protein
VDTGSARENATSQYGAFSAEVDTGSARENATNQQARFYLRHPVEWSGGVFGRRLALHLVHLNDSKQALPLWNTSKKRFSILRLIKDRTIQGSRVATQNCRGSRTS